MFQVYVSNWNELPNLKQIASILDMPDYKTEAAAEMIKDYNIDQYGKYSSPSRSSLIECLVQPAC